MNSRFPPPPRNKETSGEAPGVDLCLRPQIKGAWMQVPPETKNANIWRTWLARGPESLAATPFRDHNALAVHRSGLERTAFSHQVCQAKPWKLPVIRSENYSRAFRQEPDFSVFASKRLPHIAVGRKSSSLPCGSCHGLADCPHDMAAAVFPQSEWSKRKNKEGIRVPFIDCQKSQSSRLPYFPF